MLTLTDVLVLGPAEMQELEDQELGHQQYIVAVVNDRMPYIVVS